MPGGSVPTPNPSASSLAQFIDTAHAKGYGNIDPNVIATIGQSVGNNAGSDSMLSNIQQGLSIPNKTSQFLYEQSAMSPQQTTKKAIQDHVTNTGLQITPPQKIKDLQNSLHTEGFGLTLPNDGTWSPDWNNVLYQHTQAQQQKQGVGTFSARGVFNTVFGESWLSHAIPLVASVIKSIPGDVLKGLGDGLKLSTDAEQAINHFITNGKDIGTKALGYGIANEISNLGHKIEGQKPLTDAQFAEQGNWHSLLQIANAALTISAVSKLVEGTVASVKGGIAAGEAAGATSKAGALVKDTGLQTHKGITSWIMNSVLPQTEAGNRIAFTNWLNNVPAAKGLVAGLNKVATEGMDVYKTTQKIAATPYRLPIVGIAGKLAVNTSVAGMKLGIQGHEENWLGDPNGAAAISLDHLKPIAGIAGHALDALQLIAHGPAYDSSGPSFAIGEKVANAHAQLSDALNSLGIISDYERGTGANFLDEVNALKKAGVADPVAVRQQQISSQYMNMAAAHSAQDVTDNAIAKGIIDGSNADQRLRYLQNAQTAIRNNPDLMKQALETYYAKPQAFAIDLGHQMEIASEDGRTSLSHGQVNLTQAQILFKNHFLPNLEKLNTPDSMAQEALREKLATGQTVEPWELPNVPWSVGAKTNLEELPSQLMGPEEVKAAAAEAAAPLAKEQRTRIMTLLKDKGITDRAARLEYLTNFLGKDVKSTNDLTNGEATRLIQSLKPQVQTIRTAQSASLSDSPITKNFGLSRIESLHAPQVQALATKYFAELEKVKPGFKAPETLDNLEASNGGDFGANSQAYKLPKSFMASQATPGELALHKKVEDVLLKELGRNTRDFSTVPTEDLIKLMVEKSHWLAADVHLPADGSLDAANAALNKLGYKLNYGTDVGHNWTDPTLPQDMLGESRLAFQKAADNLGLNMAQTETTLATQAGKIAANKTLQEEVVKIASNSNNLPPWATGSRLMAYAQDVIKPTISPMASAYTSLMANRGIGNVASLRIKVGSPLSKELNKLIGTVQKNLDGSEWTINNRSQAIEYYKSTIAATNTPQTWLKKDWMEAMTSKGVGGFIKNNKGFETEALGLSTKEASDLWYAMQKGLRSTPHYVNGINPLSRLMNSSFGLANVPLAINGHRILNITGSIQPTLVSLRYSFSPIQSWLRVAKSAVKGVNESMPISYNPAASLKELGAKVENAAYDLTDKIYGVDKNAQEVSDFTNKEFNAQDLANIYNPRATLARAVHYVAQNMKEEGKSITSAAGEAELKARVDAINNYGNRTAAEKSVNAFFFPFSFEKTVIRELGGALLDNPSLRMMAAAAIATYNSSDGQKTKAWMEANLPLFKEAEKLNPFYHGVGPGGFGGINKTPFSIAEQLLYGNKAPSSLDGVSDPDKLALFVHMLMPKPITNKDSAVAALALVPALKDLSTNVIGFNPSSAAPVNWGGALKDSAKTLWWEAGSAITKLSRGQITGHANTDNWQKQGHLPYQEQQTKAWDLRSKIVTYAASPLDANSHGGNFIWPDNFPKGFAGTKIDMTSINNLVHHVYPAYDPTKAFTAIAVKQTAIAEEGVILAQKSQALADYYRAFVKQSDKIQGYIQKNSNSPKFDASILAPYMDEMRQAAAKLSAQDASFPLFYQKYYASKYGPLKGL